MPWIEIDNSKVHYTVRPGGEHAIVFLHGGFGSSSELWAGTMDALPPQWTGYAIDNFLHSDAPPEGYTMSAFARRAAGFVRAMGLHRPVFAGHSMGGGISQMTAIEYPDAVGALALVCTGAAMTNHQHRLGRDLLALLQQSGGDIDTMRAISAKWFRDPPPEPFFSRYVARATHAPLQAMIDAQTSWIEADLRADLNCITVPTLVVYAPYDTGRTIDHAKMLLEGIKKSELATMTGSGHSPMVETPEAFNAALHSFLAQFALARANV
ncbi:MAG: alpha/beta hydrolase [Pseudolabrys sp.]|nr:alpha/beta hydrolase [Pseudolabrys sp.]